MTSADQDLLTILRNYNIPVSIRIQGWEYLLNLTGSEEGIERIVSFEKYEGLFRYYIKTTGPDMQTRVMAYKCFVNLSSSSKGASFLLKYCKYFLAQLCQRVKDGKDGAYVSEDESSESDSDDEAEAFDLTAMLCCILCNLSNHSNLLKQEGFTDYLCKKWEWIGFQFMFPERRVREQYDYLSLMFSNLSGTTEGRKFLMDKGYFFRTFIKSFDNPDETDVRRLGMALTFRNCCIEKSFHKMLLEEYNILPVLLIPLMYDLLFTDEELETLPDECKEEITWRERVPQIRKAIIQAISMFCYSQEGWEYLKSHGVYYIFREFHLLETNPDVKEAVETLIGYLLVEDYADAQLDPSYTDKLQDIPDFLLSEPEELPASDAHSGAHSSTVKKVRNKTNHNNFHHCC